MIFIETLLFTKQLPDYLEDEDYRELQEFLIEQPDAGDLIQGTGGLRKLRWTLDNKGKRSGIRIIYYWQVSKNQIYFFTLYAKNEMSNLSAKEKKALKLMLEDW
ncbi:MAG: hypothetical protein K0R24_1889 [Gammaproteobacteria bacterium]|jgi:hypothetical protein|nr:hypothetical protein [Gammaproteobacteria bacterium]MCE3238908.1 hypothetical protein [Gammaproteobacteria bacterium]